MVTYGVGQQYFMLGYETTWGEYVEPTKDAGLVQSGDFGENSNIIYSYGFASANAGAHAVGRYESNFTVDLHIQHGRMFELALARGATVADAGGADPFTHTFTPAIAGVLSPFTAEFGLDSTSDIILRAVGSVVNSMRMSLDLDGVLALSLECLCKKALETSSVATSTQSTLPTFPAAYATLKFGTENSEAAQALTQNFEFNHANNIISSWGFSDRKMGAQVPGRAEENITFTAAFETNTALEDFWGGSGEPAATVADQGLIIEIKDAASSTREVTIDFDNVTFGEHRKSYTLDGITMQDITARARSIEEVKVKDDIDNWNV